MPQIVYQCYLGIGILFCGISYFEETARKDGALINRSYQLYDNVMYAIHRFSYPLHLELYIV